jgi:D-serine deaminase-like pyridoxal phosphate-dependent protein
MTEKRDLDTPALLVDIEKLDRNIATMAALAEETGVRLRPHIKAHKTVPISQKQVASGAVGVGVAKLGEAEVMAYGGILDIMITTPLVGAAKIERLRRLAHQVRVSVVVDSLDVAQVMSRMAREEGLYLDTLVEIDTGLDRCGFLPGKPTIDFVKQLVGLPNLRFAGFKTAELQVYFEPTQSDVAAMEREVSDSLARTVRELEREGIDVPNVCAGCTASAKVVARMEAVTEIHPGSYVFHSLDGVAPGAALIEDCSMTVLATIISRPAPDRAVIDAGFKTLSLVTVGGLPGYGYVKPFGEAVVLERLYEEHGVLRLLDPSLSIRIGDMVEIIPCSSSAVPNLFDEMTVVRGDRVEAVWPIWGRGKIQ